MTDHSNETRLTRAAIGRLARCKDARLKQIMVSLTRHLHGFIRETELTEREWFAAIEFLTRTGQMCTDKRQEFILLSDVLGASMLVDAINHRKPQGATESTVLGPFYVHGAKFLPRGANIWQGKGGEPTVVTGRVTTTGGKPIKGAVLDVWQTAPNGLYDVQDPHQPGMNLRGKFRTGADGRFEFRTVKPSSYPIPSDGPVGKMLRTVGRHPFRPAHIHFIVSAKGYETVATHVFVRGDKYLKSDAVFGVKDSLIADFARHTSRQEAARHKVKAPFYTVSYEFGMKTAR
jgi:hydroxyquinol 1,2-dioxygenase